MNGAQSSGVLCRQTETEGSGNASGMWFKDLPGKGIESKARKKDDGIEGANATEEEDQRILRRAHETDG